MSEFFEAIKAGLEDAIEISEGRADPSTYRVHRFEDADVKAIRKKLRLTQAAFAERFGLPIGTVRDWESRRRFPDAGSRVLLKVIAKDPEVVARALQDV